MPANVLPIVLQASDLVLYAKFWNRAGKIFLPGTGGVEDYDSTHHIGATSQYAVDLGTELGVGSMTYLLTFPANLPEGRWRIHVSNKAGANYDEAPTDTLKDTEIEDWDGTQILSLLDVISDAGNGARTVVITVDDGTDPLEGAAVRLTRGVLTHVRTTDVNGTVTFNVDDGTWAVAITLEGYSFAGASLVVDGDEAQTYSMTLATFVASAVGLVTGYLYDTTGETGVTHHWQAVEGTTTGGLSHDTTVQDAVSGTGGLIQFPDLVPGATYEFWRGITTTRKTRYTVPTDATSPHSLSDVLGRP